MPWIICFCLRDCWDKKPSHRLDESMRLVAWIDERIWYLLMLIMGYWKKAYALSHVPSSICMLKLTRLMCQKGKSQINEAAFNQGNSDVLTETEITLNYPTSSVMYHGSKNSHIRLPSKHGITPPNI